MRERVWDRKGSLKRSCSVMLFWTIVYLAVSSGVARARIKGQCQADVFEYYNEHLGCHPCDKCPPGKTPIIQSQDIKWDKVKGALTCYKCGACEPGTHNENWDYEKCIGCLSCDKLSRQVITSCKSEKNTQCGKCLQGFHDVFYAQKGYRDNTKHCQACYMNMEAPECAQLLTTHTTSAVKKQTILSTTLIPINNDNNQGKEAVNENVYPPQNLHNGETGVSTSYLLISLVGAVVVLVVVAGGIWYKWHNLCPDRPRQPAIGSGGCEESSKNKTRTVDKQENLSYVASSDNSLDKQLDGAPKRGSRIWESFRKKKIKTLCEDVEADSPYTKPLLEQRGGEIVSQADFTIIQKNIGKDWKHLARALNITDPQMEYLESDYKETSERIYQMLYTFTKEAGALATVNKLCEALKSIDRRDIVGLLAQDSSSL